MSDPHARIDELEMKLAFQEQMIAELNDTVTRLNLELARAQDQFTRLLERLDQMQTPNPGAPEPPPPHY